MGETRCGACGRKTRFKGDGTPYKHACKAEPKKGPWFASEDEGPCPGCGNRISEGDQIRYDGAGAFECAAWCGQTDPVSEPAVTVPSMDDTVKKLLGEALPDVGTEAEAEYLRRLDDKPKTEADAFLDPTTPVSGPLGDQEPLRDQWGRYLLPHPADGTYSDGRPTAGRRNGWMRVTTFAKAAADTFALGRYNERLTLVGATLRPDVVALAHGKDVREHRAELDRLVNEIKNAAGAKVAANLGTAVHSLTETWDAGLMSLEEAARHPHVDHLRLYQRALNENGLECVPGLIERTTFTSEFNVAGTFDRVYRLPDGTYAIGDLKTGRDLKYGRMEIAVQLALYAHGINANGVFDWGAGSWDEPHTMENVHQRLEVRTDVGVVVHLPVQGDLAGTCTVKTVDLRAGWTAALTAERVLRDRKGDYMRDGLYMPPVKGSTAPDWVALFKAVKSRDQANALYSQAKAAGLSEEALRELIVVGREALEHANHG